MNKIVLLFSCKSHSGSATISSMAVVTMKNMPKVKNYIDLIEQVNMDKRCVDKLFAKYEKSGDFPMAIYAYEKEPLSDKIAPYLDRVQRYSSVDDLYDKIEENIKSLLDKKTYMFLDTNNGDIYSKEMDEISLSQYLSTNRNVRVVDDEKSGIEEYIDILNTRIFNNRALIKGCEENLVIYKERSAALVQELSKFQAKMEQKIFI